MCKKVTQICCDCGEGLPRYWVACAIVVLRTRIAIREGKPQEVPDPRGCLFIEPELKPMLSGCPNNDSCPSWFGTIFGEYVDEDPEIQEILEWVAWERYEAYRERFARAYFTPRPVPPRREPVEFWTIAKRDVDLFSEASSIYGDEGEQDLVEEGQQQQQQQQQGDYEDDGLGEERNGTGNESTVTGSSSGIDPEELFYGDVVRDQTHPDAGDQQQVASVQRVGPEAVDKWNQLEPPIWTWFFPFDMARDGEYLFWVA